MERHSFANVWHALSDTPEEAAHMTIKSGMMRAIDARVRGWELTQAKAAERLGITQPRLNDLLKGKISSFSLEALIDIASKAGLTVRLEMEPA